MTLIIATNGVITTRLGQKTDNVPASFEAAEILGVEAPRYLGFEDQYLDTLPVSDLANALDAVIPDVDTVITHSRKDLNLDHRLVAEAVAIVTRPVNRRCSVLACETPGEAAWNAQRWMPNFYVDVTGFVETKILAFARYGSEARPAPHPRSSEALRALALVRGSESGLPAAEAFELVRGYPGILG